MKRLFTISFCLIVLLYSCKKDNSGGNSNQDNNPTSWLTGTWTLYKLVDTSDYQNGHPSAEVHTTAHDTIYYDIGGSNYHYTTSSGTMGSDTLKFITATTGYENDAYNEKTDFTYSLSNLTFTEIVFQNNQNMPITMHISKIASDKIKVVTPDIYGFNEIIVAYYQKQ